MKAVERSVDRIAESAIKVVIVSLGLGLLGAALFKGATLGVNLFIWLSAIFLATHVLAKRNSTQITRTTSVGLILATLSALGIAWYSSPDLRVANWIALVGGLGIAALGTRQVSIVAASVWDITGRMVFEACSALASGITIPANIPWKQLTESRTVQKQSAVFRGLLIATPLVLVFGSLFSSADAMFGQTVTTMFSVDFEEGFEWVLMALLYGVIGLSIIGAFAVPRIFRPPFLVSEVSTNVTLKKIGATELTIVLCTLCGLFGLFVFIQFKYLFGGSSAINMTAGLSYAEYARKGFFELVWVAGLALPLLVGAHAVAPNSTRREITCFRGLTTVLTCLVLVIMVSAMTRMSLYVESFGLTPMRVSVSAFMIWLATVFGWFIVSLYRNAMNRFSFGAMAAGFAVIAGLNFVTPDRMTAHYNVSRFASTSDLDTTHLARLGAESVPEVLSSWDKLSLASKSDIKRIYGERFQTGHDWRGASVSEFIAVRELHSMNSGD